MVGWMVMGLLRAPLVLNIGPVAMVMMVKMSVGGQTPLAPTNK